MAEQQYNNPGTTASSIGAQARTDFYEKKAIIAVRDKQYFSPLASVKAMPKNMGKKIKQDVYVPLLDDRNVNDQGLDAAGLIITASKWQAFNAAGTEIVTFLDGGYVGINTSSPGATLPPSFTDGKGLLEIRSDGTGTDPGLLLRRSDDVTGLDIWHDSSGGGTYGSYFDNR